MRVGIFFYAIGSAVLVCMRVTGLLSVTGPFHFYKVHQSLRSTTVPAMMKPRLETLGPCPVRGLSLPGKLRNMGLEPREW